MNTIRELTDIELNEVAGGIGVITTNCVVTGIQANAISIAGGGIGKTNVATGQQDDFIGTILS